MFWYGSPETSREVQTPINRKCRHTTATRGLVEQFLDQRCVSLGLRAQSILWLSSVGSIGWGPPGIFDVLVAVHS